jgi:hypothetical protein
MHNFVRFGRYFNIPKWEITRENGQLWRREHYIGDKSLSQCETAERIEMMKAVLRQYEAFAASEAIGPAPELTQAAISTMLECAPRSLPARIAAKHHAAMETLGASLKLLPVHGDLSAQNVFVSDGQPWIIDWDNAGDYQPMLVDPLYLVIRESELGRIDLLAAFLAGHFDTELLRIFALNGLANAPCSNLVLLVHAYLIHFHHKKAAGQRDADRRNVDDIWKPLLVYCTDYLK